MHSEIVDLLSSSTGRLPQLFAALLKRSQSLDSAFVQSGMLVCKRQSVATKFKVIMLVLSHFPAISSCSGNTLLIKGDKLEKYQFKQDVST